MFVCMHVSVCVVCEGYRRSLMTGHVFQRLYGFFSLAIELNASVSLPFHAVRLAFYLND